MTTTASRFAPYTPDTSVPNGTPFNNPRHDARPVRLLTIPSFQIPEEVAPALKSAIEEISNVIGTRLEEAHKYAWEDALTRAARALGPLRAAISSVVPNTDPNYSSR